MNILVVKLSSLGDIILSLPAIYKLKRHFKHSSIDIITEEIGAKIVSNINIFNRIIIFKRNEISNYAKRLHIIKAAGEISRLIKQVRRVKYDLAFDFQGLLRSVFFLYMAKAFYKSGKERWIGLDSNEIQKERIYSVYGYAKQLECIGIKLNQKELKMPNINIPKEANIFYEKHLSHIDKYILINAGARWKTKQLNTQVIGDIINFILSNSNYNIVFIGGVKENKHILNSSILNKSRIINLIGKTDIIDTFPIIKNASIFITPDTGLMHLSAFWETRTIAVFGPTDPKRTAPFNKNAIIVSPKLPCAPCMKRRCPRRKANCITPAGIIDKLRASL